MLLQIRTSSHQNNLQLMAFVIWHYVLDLMFWFFSEGYVFSTNIPMLSYTYSNKMMFKCCCMSSGHWLSCFWAMCLHLASWWHWQELGYEPCGVPESGWKCPKSPERQLNGWFKISPGVSVVFRSLVGQRCAKVFVVLWMEGFDNEDDQKSIESYRQSIAAEFMLVLVHCTP